MGRQLPNDVTQKCPGKWTFLMTHFFRLRHVIPIIVCAVGSTRHILVPMFVTRIWDEWPTTLFTKFWVSFFCFTFSSFESLLFVEGHSLYIIYIYSTLKSNMIYRIRYQYKLRVKVKSWKSVRGRRPNTKRGKFTFILGTFTLSFLIKQHISGFGCNWWFKRENYKQLADY